MSLEPVYCLTILGTLLVGAHMWCLGSGVLCVYLAFTQVCV
jgi:hypothetical protein